MTNELENAIKNGDWNKIIDGVDLFCKRDLTLRPMKLCYCIEKAPKTEEKALEEYIMCFHYNNSSFFTFSNKSVEKGIIFVFEGYKEAKKGVPFPSEVGLQNFLEELNNRKIPPINLGIINCYVYGDMDYEGREETCKFECKKGKME